MVVKFRIKSDEVFGLLLLILLMGCDVVALDNQYQLGPDSEIQLGVAQGAVRELTLPPLKAYPGYMHKLTRTPTSQALAVWNQADWRRMSAN
jgi:hypothetical protein